MLVKLRSRLFSSKPDGRGGRMGKGGRGPPPRVDRPHKMKAQL
jgi:hypothetical protein